MDVMSIGFLIDTARIYGSDSNAVRYLSLLAQDKPSVIQICQSFDSAKPYFTGVE